MSRASLRRWLGETASRDALLSSWRHAESGALADYELDALALVALAAKAGVLMTIGLPGGRSRLPLLAAAHAAALQLPGYPSPFASQRFGPVAFLTRQIVRRDELLTLDVGDVAVSPALHAVRVRGDGQCVPLSGGRPVPQRFDQHLLLMRDTSAPLALAPATVVIDGVDEDDIYLTEAAAWAQTTGAATVVFDDAARRRWSPDALVHCAGWAAINASSEPGTDALTHLATLRGHATVIDLGPQPDLDRAAALISDARRHGPFPAPLAEAATLWRRLDELLVPLADYDAACPRWHTRTLSERLDDLLDVRASHFPRGWGTWAEMCWAGIKEGIVAARAALDEHNRKSEILVDIVDRELRAGNPLDLALPSRIARDAVLCHLSTAGVVLPLAGQLTVRSLGDAEAWHPRASTVLCSPPTWRSRHRLTAADLGALTVLCYQHEITALRSALRHNLDEPLAPLGPVAALFPPSLRLDLDLPAAPPPIVLTAIPGEALAAGASMGAATLSQLADSVEAFGLAALDPTMTTDSDPLPGESAGDEPAGADRSDPRPSGAATIPLTVTAPDQDAPQLVQVPVQRSVLRILGAHTTRIPVLEVAPGMLVADLGGDSAFERVRPLLLEARGPVTRMLLAAWDQSLAMALREAGDVTALTRALHREGSRISSAAVAEWSDADRIGPADATDVARLGRVARHPIVADNADAVADVMARLRTLHQAVGRTIVGVLAGDDTAVDDLDALLGGDAVSIVNETVVYRVLSVGPLRMSDPLGLGDAPAASTPPSLEHRR